MSTHWITCKAAASLLDCSRQWIYVLIRAGKLRATTRYGMRLVAHEDVAKLSDATIEQRAA